jgi:hypothetical protein
MALVSMNILQRSRRLALDENLPAQLANNLRAFGHDVETVPEEGMAGYPEAASWSAANSVSCLHRISISPMSWLLYRVLTPSSC